MGASLKSTTPSRDARFAFVRQSLPPPHSGVLFPGLLVSGLAVSLSAALVPQKKAKKLSSVLRITLCTTTQSFGLGAIVLSELRTAATDAGYLLLGVCGIPTVEHTIGSAARDRRHLYHGCV